MRRIRTARAAAVLAAAAAATVATLGCGAVDKAIDCAQVANAVASDVDRLQETVSGADESPQQAAEALDAIEQDLNDFGDKADNADVGNAVDDLQQAVDNAQQAAERGEVPDVSPVGDAAGELTKVCTS